MRRILTIAVYWLVGPVIAIAFVVVSTLGPAESCPYPKGCALERVATWKHLVFLFLVVAPGLIGTWYHLPATGPGHRPGHRRTVGMTRRQPSGALADPRP